MNQNLFKVIGKAAEMYARKLRPWVLPEYRRAFAELLARGYHPPADGQQQVCCDFRNGAIDLVGGRYYFSLVKDLIDAGFHVVFVAHRPTLSTFGVYSLKKMLLRERFCVIRSLDELEEPYWLITDSDIPPAQNAKHVVKVDYEQRLCRSHAEMAFPVFVHPQIATGANVMPAYDVATARVARIFFGGNTKQGKYDKDVIGGIYRMLSRRKMLSEALACVSPEMIHRPDDGDRWLSSEDFHSFVLCETQHCKIPQERWLEALTKVDFFLACPGVDMPLCHNLVEALASGAIPILQYADYLQPPLENGVNCFAFKDAEGLRKIIAEVLEMDPERIRAMRGNVSDYYDQFLAPGCFTKRLLNGPRTLLLNAYRVPR